MLHDVDIVSGAGRQAVDYVRDSLQKLSQQNNTADILDQTNRDAITLCDAIEAAFLHGIKIKEFNGIPFWGLLERLEIMTPPCIPLRNTVGAVATMESLRSPLARARGWVRQILNDGHIDEAVMFMTAQSQLLRAFYNPGALLLSPDDGHALITVLRGVKALKFSFRVDGDPSLSAAPQWVAAAVQRATAVTVPVRSPPPQPPHPPQSVGNGAGGRSSDSGDNGGSSTSSGSTGGGALGSFNFDSFIKSVETSLDSIVGKVDAAADLAAKFINEQLEQPPGGATGGAPMLASLLGNAGTGNGNGTGNGTGTGSSSGAGAGRITPFFGSTLRDLVLDERRTPYAHLNPLLGVPTQAARMITFLWARAGTPDLFRRPVASSALGELRREVEEERDFTTSAAGADVATVALLLVQWLNQLPEPLLGYEHYDAILACAELEDPEHRARNLALLVQEASWYCKPLLARLLALLQRCVQPQLAATNRLNLIAVAVLATPCLLRPYVAALHTTPHTFFQDTEARERMQMAATAAGSTTVEFLIAHQGAVLQRIREDLAQREAALSAKCARIAALQSTATEGVDTMFPDYLDEDRQATIRELWQLLELAEQAEKGLFTPSPSQDALAEAAQGQGHGDGQSQRTSPSQQGLDLQAEQPMLEVDINNSGGSSSAGSSAKGPAAPPLHDVLAHGRWARCGFLPAELPLREFNAPFGFPALHCLVGFMRSYHKQGAAMVREYAQGRRGGATLSSVALQLVRLTMEVLRLLPPVSQAQAPVTSGGGAAPSTGPSGPTPIVALARQPSWLLLNEERSVQEVFDLALLSFEDTWKAGISQQLLPPGQRQGRGQPPQLGSDGSVTRQRGPSGTSQGTARLVAQCYAKVYGVLNDIINKKRPRTVEQMWTQWLAAKVEEQERLASSQRPIQPAHTVTLSSATSRTASPAPVREESSLRSASSDSFNSRGSGRAGGAAGSSGGASPTAQAGAPQQPLKAAEGAISAAAVEAAEAIVSAVTAIASTVTQQRPPIATAPATASPPSSSDSAVPGTGVSSIPAGAAAADDRLDDADWILRAVSDDFKESEWEESEGTPSSQKPPGNIISAPGSTKSDWAQTDLDVAAAEALFTFGEDDDEGSKAGHPAAVLGQGQGQAQGQGQGQGPQVISKSVGGVTTQVRGRSGILSASQLQQLEEALPSTYQCYDWQLVYRLAEDGADVSTLVHKGRGHSTCLLVVRDTQGAVFGALLTEQLRMGERERYYGHGTTAVWAFKDGALQFYPWSFKNSYFLLCSKESIAVGGGGNFAIYLDGDLNHGSSGPCQTFSSPCLASREEFSCQSCELFALSTAVLGL